MFKRKLLTAVVLSVAAMGAFAASKAAPLTPYQGQLPPALQFAKTAGGLEVFKKFPAEGGLIGWVVQDKNSGKDIIVYTTPGGEALIAGMMLDKNGKNLSAAYQEEHVPSPDYSASLAEFKAAPGVSVGSAKAKAEVVVVFDANCGYCKLMHKLITPAVEASELKVRYVPVAILGADSDIKGAGILASKDPQAAVNGAVAGRAETSTDKAMLAKVQANTALMKKHGFNGTPAVLYSANDKGDDTVFVANGVPNITEMFARLGVNGQLDKLKADPQLARFIR